MCSVIIYCDPIPSHWSAARQIGCTGEKEQKISLKNPFYAIYVITFAILTYGSMRMKMKWIFVFVFCNETRSQTNKMFYNISQCFTFTGDVAILIL